MDFRTYQEKALRTCAQLDSNHADYIHMVLGIVTEVGELADIYKKNMAYGKPLDLVNLREEIGDAMWYVANLCTMGRIGLDFAIAIDENPVSAVLRMVVQAGKLSELFTSEVMVDWRKVRWELSHLVGNIVSLCTVYGFDLEDILATNIAKLEARYPEKFFSAERAMNRDLDTERDILEG